MLHDTIQPKCPHCLHALHLDTQEKPIDRDIDGYWSTEHFDCPMCHRLSIYLKRWKSPPKGSFSKGTTTHKLIRPTQFSRQEFSEEIPSQYLQDYTEATNVLPISSKASAALSRRCLQNLLHNVYEIDEKNLYKEIHLAIQNQIFPTYISEALHDLREIGNFAAHPHKSEHTGEILQVEPGEAEWAIETIEMIFDFAFVQPKKKAKRKETLQAKLNKSEDQEPNPQPAST